MKDLAIGYRLGYLIRKLEEANDKYKLEYGHKFSETTNLIKSIKHVLKDDAHEQNYKQ